ncbi:N-acyl-D-amino-acid deacylase family protein [Actinopolymorpha pittospori]
MTRTSLLVRGGTIVDGHGTAPREADVLLDGSGIAEVGTNLTAPPGAEVLDASGLHVLPGFVDVHAHDDVAVLKPGFLDPKLRQGVAVTVVGNCGHGCAPVSAGTDLASYSAPILGSFPAEVSWTSFPGYLDTVETAARTTHVAALVPHGPLRAAAMGVERRPASAAETARMCDLLDEALAAGAAGMSLGLMYPPGNAAQDDELVALARVVARRDKLLVAHLRNEGDRILNSLAELAGLARRSRCAIQVSHLKVTSPANHGRMPEVLDALDALRAEGVDVTADVYPYDAGSTTASTLFPPWTVDGGLGSLLAALGDPVTRRRVVEELARPWPELENYFHTLGPGGIRLLGFSRPEHRRFEGRSLAAIAPALGMPAAECLADLVLAERGGLSVVLFQLAEPDIRAALAWPWTMVGSDGLPLDRGAVHPRLYGTFPRVLARYADVVPGLGFAEAVRRMTMVPARRFGLGGRGGIAPGQVADLVLVDRFRLADPATYDEPRRYAEGIEAVLLAGKLAWTRGGRVEQHGALVRAGSVGRL